MKVALAFFGLPRRSDIAFPSIERHLIAPAAAHADLQVRYHLYHQPRVVNPRNDEDHALGDADYAPFLRFPGALAAPPQEPTPRLLRLQSHGDAWGNGFVSLRNLVLQLESLLAVTQAVAELTPDVVLFARPDLLYHDPVTQAMLEEAYARPDEVALPRWESWGGCNDRLALAGAGAYRAYGGRVLLADHFCETQRRPMHAETFLQYALRFAGVGVRPLALRASRVRADGRVQVEDFGGHVSPLAGAGASGR